MITRQRAHQLRALIEKASASLEDTDALDGKELFPAWVPALYTEVAAPGEIPIWKQPTGAQDAYSTGDKVWYPDKSGSVYESLIDGNVWSPVDYPQGWQVVE